MQKSKKALKKPAVAAKKTAPTKKKAQPLAAKKPAAKKPVVAKKAAAKPAAKPVKAGKADPKDLKKKSAAAPAPSKASAKAVPAKPEAVKAKDKAAEKAATDKAAKKTGKAAASPAPVVDKKAEKKAEKAAAPADAAVVAKGKGKKGREENERTEAAADEEVVLTDADGRRYCRVKDCDQASTVDGYCRYHYLLFWKNIQNRKKILSEGKLERYVEELTARYPDKYLELLRKDLRSEKDFMAAIQELEIDDSGVDNDLEDEAQSYLEEVRGMSTETSTEREEDF